MLRSAAGPGLVKRLLVHRIGRQGSHGGDGVFRWALSLGGFDAARERWVGSESYTPP